MVASLPIQIMRILGVQKQQRGGQTPNRVSFYKHIGSVHGLSGACSSQAGINWWHVRHRRRTNSTKGFRAQ